MTVGNFIVENFFEMFEFLLSYVSNTMSFLRVGGFVLSHAGMMLVVMTLMEMCSAAAQPFVLVLEPVCNGNGGHDSCHSDNQT